MTQLVGSSILPTDRKRSKSFKIYHVDVDSEYVFWLVMAGLEKCEVMIWCEVYVTVLVGSSVLPMYTMRQEWIRIRIKRK